MKQVTDTQRFFATLGPMLLGLGCLELTGTMVDALLILLGMVLMSIIMLRSLDLHSQAPQKPDTLGVVLDDEEEVNSILSGDEDIPELGYRDGKVYMDTSGGTSPVSQPDEPDDSGE